MVPNELILRNFMCYRDNLPPLRFDGLHIACLSGENGAGKSALLDAITWVLWGKARMSDDDLIAQGESEMLVDLCFQLDGHTYRVTRHRKRGKSGTRSSGKSTLDFQIQSDTGWRPMSDGKILETEKRIADVLHMNYETFINASFLLQGRADEFTRKTASERKQVLADILDLGVYTRLEERAKQRAKQLDDKRKGIMGLIEHLRSEADKLPFYTQEVTKAEEQVTFLTTELEAAEQEFSTATARLHQLESQQEHCQQLQAQLRDMQAQQAEQQRKLEDLQTRMQADEALLCRQDEIAAGMQALNAARAELKRLEDLRPRYEALREQWRELQNKLQAESTRLQTALASAQQQYNDLRRQAQQATSLQAEIAQLTAQIDAQAPLTAEREQQQQARDVLVEREHQYNELRLRREELSTQIRLRQDSLIAVREEQQRQLQRLDRQLADAVRWQADLAAAREQQALLSEDEQRLVASKAREQADVQQVSDHRAECQRLKELADQIKKNLTILAPGESTCPVCHSELGHTGIEQVRQHYEDELVVMRQRYSERKKQADAGEKALRQIQAEIGQLEKCIHQRRQAVARIEVLVERLQQAASWEAERDQIQQQHQTLQQQIAARDFEREAQEALQTVEDELAELGDATTLKEELRQTEARLRTLEGQLKERSNLEGTVSAHQRTLVELQAGLSALPALEQQVQDLTHRLEQEDYGHELRAQQQAVQQAAEELGYTSEIRETARAEVERLAHWDEDERRMREAHIRLEGDRQLVQQLSHQIADRTQAIEQQVHEIAQLEAQLQALPTVRQLVRDQESTVGTQRQRREVALRELHERQARRDRAQNDQQQLEQQQQEYATLTERHSVFQELAEASGKKGVQAMLIETAIPAIEDEANRLLSGMTDNQMHLTLEMQREKKQGGLVETLEIKIGDALGTRIYDAFSGGEAMRVNFAIRVALSRLLAKRAGASLETLVIDEGFGTLDAQGRERFVEAITGVQYDFKRILVITHLEELKERFPAHIEITKTPAGSCWTLI
mgnify:CR=1 FL=1